MSGWEPAAVSPNRAEAVPFRESAGLVRAFFLRATALTRARWRPFLVFWLVTALFNILRSYEMWSGADLTQQWLMFQQEDVKAILVIGPFFFAGLIFAEALALRGIAHAAASLTALVLATSASLALLWWLNGGAVSILTEKHLIVSDAAFIARSYWFFVVSGMLLVFYLALREKEAAMAKAAHAAELERAKTERATMESRLKVIQARVEPELLFGVLADVRRRYEHDRQAADALLDDLIAYLRAALPQMRGGASTFGREAALAEAYLKVIPAGREGRLSIVLQIAPEIGDLPFPPMVLLPLVHAAAEAGIVSLDIDARTPSVLVAKSKEVAVAISVYPAIVVPGWSEGRLAGVRETLARYFDGAAMLTVGVDPDLAMIELRWPAHVG
jgi:hypothetical protein